MANNKTPEYIEFLKTRISPNVKPDVAEKMIDYALTPEEHLKSLEKIQHYCFDKKYPVENPKIFLVISQTGGGKSGLTSRILKETPNTVVIDSDAFKAFNPRKDEISAKYPTLYGFLTGIDAYIHRDEIYAQALNGHYNVLIEIAPSTKEKLFSVDFEELAKYGYSVEANVLAVSKINGLLSVHERYEGQIEAGMSAPKLTDFKRAIDSYESIELVLKDLINMQGTTLNIWQRGEEKAEHGKIFKPSPTFITNDKNVALPLFREARRLDEQKTLENFEERVATVKKQMDLRRAPTDQRAQFGQIEEIIRTIENDLQ